VYIPIEIALTVLLNIPQISIICPMSLSLGDIPQVYIHIEIATYSATQHTQISIISPRQFINIYVVISLKTDFFYLEC
jgi:hypothetical protein